MIQYPKNIIDYLVYSTTICFVFTQQFIAHKHVLQKNSVYLVHDVTQVALQASVMEFKQLVVDARVLIELMQVSQSAKQVTQLEQSPFTRSPLVQILQ